MTSRLKGENLRVCALCSAAYALRSYLYLLVHTIIAGPAALWLGTGSGETLHQIRLRGGLTLVCAPRTSYVDRSPARQCDGGVTYTVTKSVQLSMLELGVHCLQARSQSSTF